MYGEDQEKLVRIVGEWYDPETGDQLHPDLNHKPPKGPHWGWKNKLKKILQDIFKIGPPGPPSLA